MTLFKDLNRLKIIYIFLGGIGVFFLSHPILISIFFVFNLLIYLFISSKKKSFKFLFKVKWFLILVIFTSSLVGNNDLILFKIKSWAFGINYDGLLLGLMRATKVVIMLLITQIVRLTTTEKEFSAALGKIGFGESISTSVNEIFTIVLNEKKNKKVGNKKNGQVKKLEDTSAISTLMGKVGNIPQKIIAKIDSSKEYIGSKNDSIAESALSITLIRMIKIAPGLPLAPGHKNVLIFPTFIYGITKSKSKFSGLKIGFVSGIIHFLMGFGKYGPLGVFQFALLGSFFDLCTNLLPKKNRLLYLLVFGALGGGVRFFSEFCLAWLLGLPKEFYFIYLPYVMSQIGFGLGSGLVTYKIINKIKDE